MNIRMNCWNKIKMTFSHTHVCFLTLIMAIIWMYNVKHEGKYISFLSENGFINPLIASEP